MEKLAAEVHDPAVPQLAREVLMLLVDELASVWQRIETLGKRLVALHRAPTAIRGFRAPATVAGQCFGE